MIDQSAMEAASSGNSVATYGWAFLGTAWNFLGAEGVSQIADKGTAASTGDKASAAMEIAAVIPGVKMVEEGAAIVKGAVAEARAATEAAEKGLLPKPPTGPGRVPKSERDPKRLFTPAERAAKRAEQRGKCANGCGRDIDSTNSAGHHVERHADGGPSTPENHAEVCNPCHDELHSGSGGGE